VALIATMLALAAPAPAQTVQEVAVRPACDHWCHQRWLVVRPFNWKLKRIAGCESRWRWHIATGNGFYGGLQFTLGTWHSVGGAGYPHWASKLEQKYRAVKVYLRRGSWADWPVCGYR
jgi:hypothetical protein